MGVIQAILAPCFNSYGLVPREEAHKRRLGTIKLKEYVCPHTFLVLDLVSLSGLPSLPLPCSGGNQNKVRCLKIAATLIS